MKVFPTTRTPEFDYPGHNLNEINDAHIFLLLIVVVLSCLYPVPSAPSPHPDFCYQGHFSSDKRWPNVSSILW